MPSQSAGILLYRLTKGRLEVFLAHPGGPFWAKKDRGAWTIPKGEFEANEEPITAAVREFFEETGAQVHGPFIPLGSVRQRSGKVVSVWAAEWDLDPQRLKSNSFSLEWPPKSGRQQEFPEVDKAAWFSVEEGRMKMHSGQLSFIERLQGILERRP
ncbi:MAG TPA: NUDIX hydrolase [Deltaproteobacteria bacterium]|nr:NUDIX hydrolase [Deltaproteobacteria bacterium]